MLNQPAANGINADWNDHYIREAELIKDVVSQHHRADYIANGVILRDRMIPKIRRGMTHRPKLLNHPGYLRLVRPETGPGMIVLASGTQTGSEEVFRQTEPEGSGPPPHNHPWEESIYVIRGNIAFGIGAEERIVALGTLVHLPAGTTHWFRFTEGGGEMLSMTSREGACHMFTDFDREISPEAPEFGRLVVLGPQHGRKIPISGQGALDVYRVTQRAGSEAEDYLGIGSSLGPRLLYLDLRRP